jgi:hypothetical protein
VYVVREGVIVGKKIYMIGLGILEEKTFIIIDPK